MTPDVSVVIPVWNGEAFIKDAVGSALGQEGVTVDVIVVDDASTDRTVEVVTAIADVRVRIIRHTRNAGPGAARNTAFAQATGRWLAVLDADDTMEPDRLRHLVDLADSAGVTIVADNLRLMPSGAPMFGPEFFPRDGILHLEDLVASERLFVKRWTLGYLKPLFARDFVLSNAMSYRTDIQIGEDFIFLADCLASSARMCVDPVPRYNYSVREGSISSRTAQSHVNQMLRAQSAFEDRHHLRPEWQSALAKRRAGLEAAAAYLTIVDHVKARRFGSAFAAAIAHPRGALLLRLPIRARLRRLRGRP
ncbi:glycosyltransferase family 2 protein [Mesorhizobium sp. CAU 1741]